MSDPIADCLQGRISAPVAVARMLLAGACAADIRARVEAARTTENGDAWKALRATLDGRDRALDRLAAEIRETGSDHTALPGPGSDPVARVAAFFDRAAAFSPEAGVALYSLGDPALLAQATEEIAAWLHGRSLLRDGMDVLDLGCGIGRMLPVLAARARSVLGLDVSARMVDEARRRCALPNVRAEQTDGRGLDQLAPDSLDLILAVDSFPYIVAAGPDVLRRHLDGAARALRPGGTLAILNFSYRMDPAADAADAGSARGLTVAEAGATPFRLWDASAYVLRRPVIEVVHLTDRPDLAALAARWTWDAYWRDAGYTLDDVHARISAGTARSGTPQTFFALVDDTPAATASFSATDMPERPELTPWLAGVYTDPAFRGHGLATLLVRRVERAARDAGHSQMWLYTRKAEGLYRTLGWVTVERVGHPGKPDVAVMRIELGPG